MVPENQEKDKFSEGSITSVLSDEEINDELLEEEVKLLESRVKEDDVDGKENVEKQHLDVTQFSKLDELLTQTQMYTEFLLEKMDDITIEAAAENETKTVGDKKKGRPSRRKAAPQYDNGVSTNTFDLNKTMYPIVYGGDAPNAAGGFNISSSRFCSNNTLDSDAVKVKPFGKIQQCAKLELYKSAKDEIDAPTWAR